MIIVTYETIYNRVIKRRFKTKKAAFDFVAKLDVKYDNNLIFGYNIDVLY